MESTGRHIIFLLALCLLLSSCSKEKPSHFREHIQGTWLLNSFDGEEVPLDEYLALTFAHTNLSTDGTVECYGVYSSYDESTGQTNRKWAKNNLIYDLYCCDMQIRGSFYGLFGYLSQMSMLREYDYLESTDTTITLSLRRYIMDDTEAPAPYSYMSMDKLPLKYDAADSIYGVWQFKTKNGADFSNYRIQFLPDKVLNFLSRVGENEWTPIGSENYYNLYDDFIALTLWDNPEFGSDDVWDVKCVRIEAVKPEVSLNLVTQTDKYSLSFISPN